MTARHHLLTINLEDYFQVAPLHGSVPERYWDRFEPRIAANTAATLDLLDEVGARATFFVNGWIAERQPAVVAEVAERGHEVASKGYRHRSLAQMSGDAFAEDAVRAKAAVERASGQRVHGYRIAHGMPGPADLRMLERLRAAGYRYDSSVRPFAHRFSDALQRRVYKVHGGPPTFWEVPLSSIRVGGLAFPIAGGNFLRQLPEALITRAMAAWDAAVPAPLVVYFHVWELDPAQPRVRAISRLQGLRQYRNLGAMPARLRAVLTRYRFTTIADHLGLEATALTPDAPPAPVDVRRSSPARGRPVTIVAPCFNEAQTLAYLANTLAVLARRLAPDYALAYVFVDDGSTDDTWIVLGRLFGDRADCQLVQHERNLGVAAATLTGIRAAETDVVAVIDCDCSYDLLQLEAMLPLLAAGVDVVTASPYHRDGRVHNVPGWRLALSRNLSRLYRALLHHKLATYTSCFRVYRRRAVAGLEIHHGGFYGVAEILARLDLQGARIVECPAVLEARLLGHSKMKVGRTIAGHLRLLAEVAWTRNRRAAGHVGKEFHA